MKSGPLRHSRWLHSLCRWGHGQKKPAFCGSPGSRRADRRGIRERARLAVGGDHHDRRGDRVRRRSVRKNTLQIVGGSAQLREPRCPAGRGGADDPTFTHNPGAVRSLGCRVKVVEVAGLGGAQEAPSSMDLSRIPRPAAYSRPPAPKATWRISAVRLTGIQPCPPFVVRRSVPLPPTIHPSCGLVNQTSSKSIPVRKEVSRRRGPRGRALRTSSSRHSTGSPLTMPLLDPLAQLVRAPAF